LRYFWFANWVKLLVLIQVYSPLLSESVEHMLSLQSA
jgi:hypothetical protein